MPIERLAAIIGVSDAAVIAAQRILGHVRIAHQIWFGDGVTVAFVEEARLAFATEQSAARRASMNASPPPAGRYPPRAGGARGDNRPGAAGGMETSVTPSPRDFSG